ncbi:MAG: hypothetical protein AAF802_28550 [Planctomycetota bacterium]
MESTAPVPDDGYLHLLRHSIARRHDNATKTYDVFGVALLGACAFVVVLPLMTTWLCVPSL